MIGLRLGLALQIAAWLLIVAGPINSGVVIFETLTGLLAVPSHYQWQFLASQVQEAVLPIVQGAVLLTLISIDKRMSKKV